MLALSLDGRLRSHVGYVASPSECRWRSSSGLNSPMGYICILDVASVRNADSVELVLVLSCEAQSYTRRFFPSRLSEKEDSAYVTRKEWKSFRPRSTSGNDGFQQNPPKTQKIGLWDHRCFLSILKMSILAFLKNHQFDWLLQQIGYLKSKVVA